MKKIRLFLTGLLLMVGCAAFAQNISVKGTVTDAESGEPVAGAAIVLQSNNATYAIADASGNYTISVPKDGVLNVSFLGYVKQSVAVEGRSSINILLTPEATDLDEVLVVAYGTATKSSFTGSAAQVKAEAIEAHVATSVTTALAGTTAGVQVISSSGDPASGGPTIRIRGIGSMSASNNPLYVVDGMPYDGSISDINPSDVESMSVLKDAAANAIYGARGANGVVLITTKRATSGNLPNIKFDAKFGSNSRLIPNYDVINDPAQYYETYFKLLYNKLLYAGKSAQEAYTTAIGQLFDENNGGLGYQVYTLPEGENLIGTNLKFNPNATLGYDDGEYYYIPDDWYNSIYHNSFRQEYNLSVSGKKDKLSYYGSVGYLDNGGMVENSRYQRFTGRINAEYQAKDWMKFITNISYSHSDSQTPDYDDSSWGSSGSIFYITNTIAPIYPLYVRESKTKKIMEEDGRIIYDANQTNQKRAAVVGNAVRDNMYDTKQNYADVLNGKVGVVFTPVKGLNISANLGLFNDNTRYNALYSKFGNAASYDGAAYVTHSRYFATNMQALADYTTDFKGSNNHLNVLAGYERYSLMTQGLSGYNTYLFNPFVGELSNADGKSNMSTASSTNRYLTEGFLARVQYDYAEKYFVSASYRRDASSRFAEGHRWGNFGSFGAAWLISKEDFMADASWINMLKIKASWGMQGNDNIGGYYPYADQYTHSYNESTGEYSLTLSYKGNTDLTWESSNAINAGVDFEFFNGYLNGTIEYFNRITTDMLYNKQVPLSSGNPTGYYPINVGSVKNEGVEISLDGKIISTKNVKWNWNVNATTYKNKILSLDPDIEKQGGIKGSYYIYRVGGSFYNAYMLESAGLSEQGEALYYMDVKDASGNVTGRTTTNDPTKANQYDLGSIMPKVQGGFGTSLSVYGVDLSAQFSFQLGGRYYDGSYQALMHTQNNAGQAMHKDLLNAWTPENTNTDIPRLDGNVLLAQTACDRFLVSSNYLSLNNLQIGYTFPEKWMKKIKFGSLRIYAAGENLFVLTARQGIDPRDNMGLGAYTQGSGNSVSRYGAMRNISGGLSVTF